MRTYLRALVAIVPAIVAARILPEHQARAKAANGVQDVRAATSYHARFSVPLPDYLDLDSINAPAHDELDGGPESSSFPGSAEDSISFGLDLVPSSTNCGNGSLTVNGLSIPQGSENASATGYSTISAIGSDGSVKHVIDAEWASFCLSHPSALRDGLGRPLNQTLGQFLSFIIKRLDGQPLEDDDHGFSASYVQYPSPRIFRFESAVLPKPEGAATRDWLLASHEDAAEVTTPDTPDTPPGPSPDEVVSDAPSRAPPTTTFDDDVRELERLEAEAHRAREAAKAQRRILWGHVTQEFSRLKEDIRQCDGLRCVVTATMGRAQGALRMIRTGYRAHRAHHTSQRPVGGEPRPRWAWFWKLPWNRNLPHRVGCRSCQSTAAGPAPVLKSLEVAERGPTAVAENDRSADDHHPSFPAHPKFPDVLPTDYERRQRFLLAALVGLQILACALLPVSILFFVLRRCVRPCRAHRRWQRESRHRANLVRRAHRHHSVWCWVKGLWRDPRLTDYEEKRALVVEQERILECAMHEELRQLRTAAEAVSSLVRSDTADHPHRSGPWTQHRSPYAPPSGASSRRNSLPDYRSEVSYGEPPPTYDDSHIDDPLASVVVDGFQYDSGIGSSFASHSTRWTPGSSVVGTSVHGDISSDEEDR